MSIFRNVLTVVGNVGEFVLRPEFATARIRPGSNVADVESSHFALLIAVLTGLKVFVFFLTEFIPTYSGHLI
jgi:hypothetical protein